MILLDGIETYQKMSYQNASGECHAWVTGNVGIDKETRNV